MSEPGKNELYMKWKDMREGLNIMYELLTEKKDIRRGSENDEILESIRKVQSGKRILQRYKNACFNSRRNKEMKSIGGLIDNLIYEVSIKHKIQPYFYETWYPYRVYAGCFYSSSFYRLSRAERKERRQRNADRAKEKNRKNEENREESRRENEKEGETEVVSFTII